MEIKSYDPLDYWMLCSWWSGHGWTPPSQEMLPEIGFVVDNIAAGFLYKTDSKITWLEFIIANPRSEKNERSKALDLVIEQLYSKAKELGFKAVFTSATHKGLIDRYKKHGFEVSDLEMTNLVKRIV